MDPPTRKLGALWFVVVMVLSVTAGVAFGAGWTAAQTGNAGNGGNAGNVGNATVSFADQETEGTSVTVESVNLSEGGFVAIHNSSLFEGDAVGSVIGVSEYLGPGPHENVTVDLFDVPGVTYDRTALTENQTLVAMPHRDTNGNLTYDFVRSDGGADVAYVANGAPVTDAGNVTVTSIGPGATGFQVTGLTAPSVVEQGQQVRVAATVTNPGDAVAAERVEYRFDGTVIQRDRIRLQPGESTAVRYTLNTSEVELGTHFHGVYAERTGSVARLVVVDEIQSFEVVNLAAPKRANIGRTVKVNAVIRNPNDFAVEQRVEYRFQGDLIERRTLALGAGQTRPVKFELATAGREPGTYVHSVFTRDLGENALITLSTPGGGPPDDRGPDDDEDDEADGDEADDDDESETDAEGNETDDETDSPTDNGDGDGSGQQSGDGSDDGGAPTDTGPFGEVITPEDDG